MQFSTMNQFRTSFQNVRTLLFPTHIIVMAVYIYIYIHTKTTDKHGTKCLYLHQLHVYVRTAICFYKCMHAYCREWIHLFHTVKSCTHRYACTHTLINTQCMYTRGNYSIHFVCLLHVLVNSCLENLYYNKYISYVSPHHLSYCIVQCQQLSSNQSFYREIVASFPASPSFSMFHAEKQESLGDNVTCVTLRVDV